MKIICKPKQPSISGDLGPRREGDKGVPVKQQHVHEKQCDSLLVKRLGDDRAETGSSYACTPLCFISLVAARILLKNSHRTFCVRE